MARLSASTAAVRDRRKSVGRWSGERYSKVLGAKQELAGSLLYGQLELGDHLEAMAFDAARVPSPMSDINVVGVGVGQRVRHGALVGELCVKIYVERKVPADQLGREHLLPTSIAGVATDVEEVGVIQAFGDACSDDRHDHLRPAPCGVSVGHRLVNAGTIGAVVRDRGRPRSDVVYVLSNNHVLAAANRGAAGDRILQPGPLDGGKSPSDDIGGLARFVELDFKGVNTVDAAIAEVEPGAVDPEICAVGPITGTTRATSEMTVFKHGRTSAMTRGVITDVNADIRVGYPTGFGFFEDQILIRGVPPTAPFSQPGDSGAAIVDGKGRICGLLFSGSVERDATWANPIQDVFSRLRIKLP